MVKDRPQSVVRAHMGERRTTGSLRQLLVSFWTSTDGGGEVGPRHCRTAMCKGFHLDITQLNLMKYGVTSVIDFNLYERRREVSRDSIYAYSLELV